MNSANQPWKNTIVHTLLFAGLLLYPFIMMAAYLNTNTAAPSGKANYSMEEIRTFQISLEPVSPDIHTLAADSDNLFRVRVLVRHPDGTPVNDAEISLTATAAGNKTVDIVTGTSIIDAASSVNTTDGQRNGEASAASGIIPASGTNPVSGINPVSGTSTGSTKDPAYAGTFRDGTGKTDSEGCFLAEYVPPSSVQTSRKIELLFRISHAEQSAALEITLIPTPIVLIHGYQASPDIFSGLSAYLISQGFDPAGLSYDSGKGVASGAGELSAYLAEREKNLMSKGIQTKRFDIIAHSMGGLVARYYTCGNKYQSYENVRKLIFLSVPQHGSPFASLGLKYYNDPGIRDLITDGALYNTAFPSMTNGGLNPSIQTGSILGQYDEVVSAESASLSEWNIKTELFDIGDSNFTIDKLLSGELLQAANHKLILYNRKVYQRICQMLENDLPYPAVNKVR